jgi:hypothetical protein
VRRAVGGIVAAAVVAFLLEVAGFIVLQPRESGTAALAEVVVLVIIWLLTGALGVPLLSGIAGGLVDRTFRGTAGSILGFFIGASAASVLIHASNEDPLLSPLAAVSVAVVVAAGHLTAVAVRPTPIGRRSAA